MGYDGTLAYRRCGGCAGHTLPAPCSPVPDITSIMERVFFVEPAPHAGHRADMPDIRSMVL